MLRILRRVGRILSTVLVVLGVATLLIAGGIYAYAAYERYQFEQQLPALMQQLEASPAPESEAVAETAAAETTVASPTQESGEAAVPRLTVTASPTTTPQRRMPPARRVVIPKIEVDSPVVEAKIQDGEWLVPKFLAGHLERTANPGENGNVVLSGHVESITSGNVFARLEELRAGDGIALVAGDREFAYVVTSTILVANNDLSVVEPTSEETITLITCAGVWNPLTRDYTRRLIVTGKPAPGS